MTVTAAQAPAETLTPEEVHDVAFTPVRFVREGYDQTEVDNFLDRVENQLRTNDEYATGLLKLLQDHGIMAPSREEAPEIPEAPAVAVAVVPISDPANITVPEAA